MIYKCIFWICFSLWFVIVTFCSIFFYKQLKIWELKWEKEKKKRYLFFIQMFFIISVPIGFFVVYALEWWNENFGKDKEISSNKKDIQEKKDFENKNNLSSLNNENNSKRTKMLIVW